MIEKQVRINILYIFFKFCYRKLKTMLVTHLAWVENIRSEKKIPGRHMTTVEGKKHLT